MMLPAAIPIAIPIVVGVIRPEMLGGLLIGTIVTGIFLAIAMTSGGRRLGQREEDDRGRPLRRQGLQWRMRQAITGDTVGDPYKDTAGPAINPMIKIANIVAILLIPIIASIHG